jgi:hypothetical protein
LLDELITALAKRNIKPIIDHWVSKSPPQLKSQDPLMIILLLDSHCFPKE